MATIALHLREAAHKRGAHARDGFPEVLGHELSRQPQHAPPAAPELAVAPRVRHAASGVIRTIHFNHEPTRGDRQVCDVPANDVLATDHHAELPAAELPEERFFRGRRREAHGARPSFDDLRVSELPRHGTS